MDEKAKAAEQRERRRQELKRKIRELQNEVTHLQSSRQELVDSKAKLLAVGTAVDNGMTSTTEVNTQLGEDTGKRIKNDVKPLLESILDRASTIKSNIDGYIGEIDTAIADLDSAISYRNSRIRYYKNQL